MNEKQVSGIVADLMTVAGFLNEIGQRLLAMSNGDIASVSKSRAKRLEIQKRKPKPLADPDPSPADDLPLPTAKQFYGDLIPMTHPKYGEFHAPHLAVERRTKGGKALSIGECYKRRVVSGAPLPKVLTPDRLAIGRIRRGLTQAKLRQLLDTKVWINGTESCRQPHLLAELEPKILEIFRKIDSGELRIRHKRRADGSMSRPLVSASKRLGWVNGKGE